jgi:hypothetical protein
MPQPRNTFRAETFLAPEGFERSRIGREREDLLPASVAERDQQQLVNVERASEALPASPVDGDRVLVVGEGPAELAAVGPVGQPPRLPEEPEDLVAPAILAGHGDATWHTPDRVLRDHLEQHPRVAAGEGREDTLDVVERGYRSSGAIVSPQASSWAW